MHMLKHICTIFAGMEPCMHMCIYLSAVITRLHASKLQPGLPFATPWGHFGTAGVFRISIISWWLLSNAWAMVGSWMDNESLVTRHWPCANSVEWLMLSPQSTGIFLQSVLGWFGCRWVWGTHPKNGQPRKCYCQLDVQTYQKDQL